MERNGTILCLSFVVFVFLSCYIQPGAAFDHCNLIKDCNECLRNYSQCAWCPEADWPHNPCYVEGAWYVNATCPSKINFKSTVTVKETYSHVLDDINQVTPTRFSVNLRAKDPVSQIIKVKPAKNYPIDSYYLMDFSYSMRDDLENLKFLARNLTEEFKKVSENYTIGFGTFIDKNVAPYSYTDPVKLENPCFSDLPPSRNDIVIDKCPPAYSFRNEMSLRPSLETFENTLNELHVSSNVDYPEGGFEALLQVASCDNRIGFREKSRKIVIYASDAGIHIAGDGKLAGLVEPNSGRCALDGEDKYYNRAEEQDYPAIEQVNQMLIRKNIIPIFAIGSEYIDLYKDLSDHMTQLSEVGLLSSDSSNIVELVRDALYRITSAINLVILDDLGYQIEIEPLCDESVPNGCTNVKYGEEVHFKVTFTLEECKDEKLPWKIVPIIIPGFNTVFVNVTHNCNCNCYDNSPVSEDGQDFCSGRGDAVCGSCQCRPPYFGEDCECSDRFQKKDTLCMAPTSNLICSSQGRCECGKCVCRNPQTPPGVELPYVRYGEFCECSNYECPKGGNGEICSGLGNCHCGECRCDETKYGVPKTATTEGKACDCELAQDKCFNPNPDGETGRNGTMACSGPEQGDCECNRCICKPNYRGRYCEECIFCGPLQCDTHYDCVLCYAVKVPKADNPDEMKLQCDDQCGEFKVNYTEVDARVDVDQLVDEGWTLETACGEAEDDEYNCRTNFYIFTRMASAILIEDHIEIGVFYDKEIECDEFALIWIILLIIGLIVLLGLLLLLLWKCWSIYVDKKLYAQFEEEANAQNWNQQQSPIYEKPITTHTNPLFIKD